MYIYKFALDCVINYLFFVVEILPFLRQYICELWRTRNFTVATLVSFFRAFMASHRTHLGEVRLLLRGFLLLYHTITWMIAYAQK